MSLDFKTPSIEDKKQFDDALKNCKEMGYEYAFGSAFIWSRGYGIKICRYKDFMLISRGTEADLNYSICGDGDLKSAITVLEEYVLEKNLKLKLRALTEEKVEEIEKLIPGKFEFKESRDHANYIYSVKELAELSGKKFRSKRNHVSKFNRLYNEYEICSITNENLEECISLSERWFKENKDIKSGGIMNEVLSLEDCFKNYDALNFKGIIIKINGLPVAFTIGEEINKKVFLTHFEKALKEYEGSYNVVNQEFSKELLKNNYELVNREEDLGIEGLRKAKLSYRPEILLKQYIAFAKE